MNTGSVINFKFKKGEIVKVYCNHERTENRTNQGYYIIGVVTKIEEGTPTIMQIDREVDIYDIDRFVDVYDVNLEGKIQFKVRYKNNDKISTNRR